MKLRLKCPQCGEDRAEPHCAVFESQACDLIKCLRCEAFGTPDGRLWQSMR